MDTNITNECSNINISNNINNNNNIPSENNISTNTLKSPTNNSPSQVSSSQMHASSLIPISSPISETEEEPDFAVPKNDPEEFNYFKSTVAAFFNYQIDSFNDLKRMEHDFNSLEKKYLQRLTFDYLGRFERLRKAIGVNYDFLLKVVEQYKGIFKLYKNEKGEVFMESLTVEQKNIIKIRSTLKLFIRDWTKEGAEERKATYEPILNDLKAYFSDKTKEDFEKGINILLPGAGLGRLMFEVACLGFKAQGNEFSYFMLLCSNFILNNSSGKDDFIIQPLIHTFSNLYREDDPFKQFSIPDVSLLETLSKSPTGEMSMVAGEFVRVYKKNPNFWDGVVTCFFLDTANNVIEYIETIHDILKANGVWINIGPLLYHYTEVEGEISIELSWEEIRNIILGYGFEIKKEKEIKCTYSSISTSMMQTVYKCVYFIAVKKK